MIIPADPNDGVAPKTGVDVLTWSIEMEKYLFVISLVLRKIISKKIPLDEVVEVTIGEMSVARK